MRRSLLAAPLLAVALGLMAQGCARYAKSEETDNPQRLITLREADLPWARGAVPRLDDLRLAGPGRVPGTVLAITYDAQVDWMREAGVEVLDETEEVPRRFIDPTFHDRRRGPLQTDAEGGLILPAGYRDVVMGRTLLMAFAERHPEITELYAIGQSWNREPLLALKISDNPASEEDEPAVFFNGAHHGSELLSQEPVWDTIKHLCENYGSDPDVTRWVDSNEIWCMPQVNPDGIDAHWHLSMNTGRKNGRDLDGDGLRGVTEGVDLNRNYPFMWARGGDNASSGEPDHSWYRGHMAASEPETQAIMALADAERFVFSVTYHTAANRILIPYTIDDVENPEPSAAWAVAREFEPLISSGRARPYQLARNLYSVDGTDQDWHHFTHGTIAYLPELPVHNPDYATHRDTIVEGIRPLWMHLLDRIETGPGITGHVYDGVLGHPIEARVVVSEEVWHHGEIHTTHPETGRYDKILAAPGTYHIRFSSQGYGPQEFEVTVGEGERVELNAYLDWVD